MIYWNDESTILATGLSLKQISTLLAQNISEEELISQLELIGLKYKERYLVAKEYFSQIKSGNQKLPLILLIAGMPGVGKTALAKELSVAFNIGITIGGDALRSSLRTVLPKENNEVFFTSVYDSWKVFGEQTKKNLIAGFLAQSEIMNSVTKRMIVDRGLRDGESMIIEYLHFLPSQFETEIINHPSIIPIIMEINDKKIYKERIETRTKYSHLRSTGERLLKQMETYLFLQEYQCSEARKNELTVINFNDFPSGLEQTFDFIIERIKAINIQKDYSRKIDYLEKIEKERKDFS
ncbi:MAG TPA: AAA family ATPase [candidate division Zixibacteria bacterium]|nr:AAA family ATPase [candidate division Zixibacteria bacterium]